MSYQSPICRCSPLTPLSPTSYTHHSNPSYIELCLRFLWKYVFTLTFECLLCIHPIFSRMLRFGTPGLRVVCGVAHIPNTSTQSRDWERVSHPRSCVQLGATLCSQFYEAHGSPSYSPSPHTEVSSSNASIASSTVQWILPDSPIHHYGLREVAIAGEERLHSRTELKWGEAEAMGFRGSESSEIEIQSDLTNSALTYLHPVMLFFLAILRCAPGRQTELR